MTSTCPCCGQSMFAGAAPIHALQAAPLSAVRRTIVSRLARSYPRSVAADDLLADIYSGSTEPENARQALTVQIHHVRDIIHAYGWTIPQAAGGRGNTAMYRLERLP